MKKLGLLFLTLIVVLPLFAQSHRTQNIIIVTLDGFRWQELYRGADSALINSKYTDTKADIKKKFWAETPVERRKLLMPFFCQLWQVKVNYMATGIWAIVTKWQINIISPIRAITKYSQAFLT